MRVRANNASGGGGGSDFSFSAENLITKKNGGSNTYTFDKAYKKCLVVASMYLYGQGTPSLNFTNCTAESASDVFYGANGAYTANAKAWTITDVAIGATVSTATTFTGFIIYAIE